VKATSVLDVEQGVAKDLGRWSLEEDTEEVSGKVQISMEDDDEINFTFGDGAYLAIPADRIRQLLKLA
jgi:hypothetical protein